MQWRLTISRSINSFEPKTNYCRKKAQNQIVIQFLVESNASKFCGVQSAYLCIFILLTCWIYLQNLLEMGRSAIDMLGLRKLFKLLLEKLIFKNNEILYLRLLAVENGSDIILHRAFRLEVPSEELMMMAHFHQSTAKDIGTMSMALEVAHRRHVEVESETGHCSKTSAF